MLYKHISSRRHDMAEITLKGETVRTIGNLPAEGGGAPEFSLVSTDLSDVRLSDFKGKRLIMNIFPSVETVPCAESVRRFNEMADALDNTQILCISRDLPFAHARFNTAEGIDTVVSLSEMRNNDFGESYGVRIVNGPFAGLLSRGVLVLDENHRVVYRQLVTKIEDEPDYEAAIAAAEKGTAKETESAAPPTDSGLNDFCEKKPTGEHARLFDDDDACDESRSGKI
jgi:thioredoxin-dependent peroxiredoxin